MIFTVPIPEKISLNKIYAGLHFRQRSAHKDLYYWAVVAANAPKWPGPYPVAMHYHFKLHGPPLDASNHGYMIKLLEDALVRTHVIAEDDQKYVAKIIVSAEKADRDEVVIEISPH